MGLANESVGAMTEEERSRRRWCTRLPSGGNTDNGQRDSGHLAVPSSSAAVRHRAGAKPTRQWNKAMGKPRKSGRMRTSA